MGFVAEVRVAVGRRVHFFAETQQQDSEPPRQPYRKPDQEHHAAFLAVFPDPVREKQVVFVH